MKDTVSKSRLERTKDVLVFALTLELNALFFGQRSKHNFETSLLNHLFSPIRCARGVLQNVGDLLQNFFFAIHQRIRAYLGIIGLLFEFIEFLEGQKTILKLLY